MLKKIFPILILFFFHFNFLKGNTFTVISNADSGPGSLREAIGFANANGTVAFDTILFNLPDISEAGRTINLQSQLPSLSSKIVIDASSQNGSAIGISFAKIILFLDHFTSSSFTFLLIQNATDVKIFAICFRFFGEPDAGSGDHNGVGVINSSNITLGSPGKGNLFASVRFSLTNEYPNFPNNSVSNVTVQGNVFGYNHFNLNNGRGSIYLHNAANILIGGSQPDEGNIFTTASIILYETQDNNFSFFTTIDNNRFGTNWDGSIRYRDGGIIDLSGNSTDSDLPVKTQLRNNLLTDGTIGLTQIQHKTILQNNKLGTDITGLNCIDVVDIIITFCKDVVIGGHQNNEENIINGSVYNQRRGMHFIKNKISGNIGIAQAISPNDPFIKILSYENNLISGQSNPNAKIQLYSNICNFGCQRKKYSTTVYANSSGNWSVPYLTSDPNFIATATIEDSSTSEFSTPKVNQLNQIIRHATCGRSNGSVTGISVTEGTHIKWKNDLGQVISTDTNLVNVPPGRYTFEVSNGENGCPWGGGIAYIIEDLQLPPSLPLLNVTDPSCGLNNGFISVNSFSYGSKWMNSNMDSIGTGSFINRLFPGTYYLKLWFDFDPSCNRIYGPFVLNNQSGPTLAINAIQINNATCTNANGSITGLSTTNVTGTPFIQWLDSLNNPVGSSLNLTNVPGGKYKLKFKDQSGCDTIITPVYNIPATGRIFIDTTGKNLTAAGCTINNGSIRNINVTGADSYSWQNLTTNNPAGNTINIFNLSPGNYQLTATNATGCNALSPIITIQQAVFAPIGVTGTQARNAFCGEDNGVIQILSFNKDSNLYSFHWIDSTTNQPIGIGTSIDSLGAGTYLLVATDTNGCQKQIYKSTIGAFPKPVINLTGIKITDDKCSASQGAINGIVVSGILGPTTTYTWRDVNNNIAGTTLNLQNISQGQYNLTVVDGGVCTIQSNLITVGNTNSPGIVLQYDDQVIPRNTPATLTIKNFQPGNYFLYSDPGGTQLIQQNSSGIFNTNTLTSDAIYYIKYVSGTCTSSLKPVKVSVVDKSFFVIASAFTPNNDGLNDKLNLKIIGLIDVDYFRIFNRNGEEVFFTKIVNEGWDGKIKGILQPTGVYVWIAGGKDINGKPITDKGTFMLIR